MSREEAIDIIKCLAWHTRPNEEDIEQAIKVLSQEPSRDMEEIEEVINCDADAETKCKMISNIVYSKPHYFKALSQEPAYCDRNICLKNEYNGIGCDECEVTKSQELCEDAMNRILKRMWICRGKHTTSIDKVKMEQILRDELLSVNPQPKTGHWIDRWWEEGCEGDCVRWRCSECKELSCCNSNFCGDCGARMVEPQESEEV